MTTLNTIRFAAHPNQAQFGLNRKVIIKQAIASAARPVNYLIRLAKAEPSTRVVKPNFLGDVEMTAILIQEKAVQLGQDIGHKVLSCFK